MAVILPLFVIVPVTLHPSTYAVLPLRISPAVAVASLVSTPVSICSTSAAYPSSVVSSGTVTPLAVIAVARSLFAPLKRLICVLMFVSAMRFSFQQHQIAASAS